MKSATEGFLVTLDNGQRFPCRDAAEVADMITAFILIEKLKKPIPPERSRYKEVRDDDRY